MSVISLQPVSVVVVSQFQPESSASIGHSHQPVSVVLSGEELADPVGSDDLVNRSSPSIRIRRLRPALEQEQNNLPLLLLGARRATPAATRILHGEMKRG